MILYRRVFRCDLCGAEKETDVETGRVPFKYGPPEGWKNVKDGVLLMCDACARKLAAPDPGATAGVAKNSAKDAAKAINTASSKDSAKDAIVTARN